MRTHSIRVRGELFDWDGTLLNSYRADSRAYLSMFRALGIRWTERDLARHYSPDWYRVYEAAGIPPEQWARADRLWTNAYLQENPPLLPGARQTLETLKRKYLLGLVTSGDRRRVMRQIRSFGFDSLFAICICAEDAPQRKPHPAPLRRAVRGLRLSPGDCVYVGDAPEDIEMARSAGVPAIGVLGPFPTARRVRAARPRILLPSVRDLPRILVPLT